VAAERWLGRVGVAAGAAARGSAVVVAALVPPADVVHGRAAPSAEQAGVRAVGEHELLQSVRVDRLAECAVVRAARLLGAVLGVVAEGKRGGSSNTRKRKNRKRARQ